MAVVDDERDAAPAERCVPRCRPSLRNAPARARSPCRPAPPRRPAAVRLRQGPPGRGRKPGRRRSSRPIRRSRKPPGVLTNWRIGRASKNSLATRSRNPAGTSSIRSCQDTRRARLASVSRWTAFRRSLVSTMCTVALRRQVGRELFDDPQDVGHHRSPAGAELGQPDAGRTAAGLPGMHEKDADHLAEELADSGAVTKSPARPKGSGCGSSRIPDLRGTWRSTRPRRAGPPRRSGLSSVPQAVSTWPGTSSRGGCADGTFGGSRTCHRPYPDKQHGQRKHHPHRQPAAVEIAQLRIRFTEELRKDAAAARSRR